VTSILTRLGAFITCFELLSLVGIATEPAPISAYQSCDALKAEIIRYQSRLQSLKVTYDISILQSPKIRPGEYIHRIMAAWAPASFFLDSGHGYPGISWEDDYARQVAYITSSSNTNMYPVSRAFIQHELKEAEELPGTLKYESFLVATGIWPLNSRRPASIWHRPQMLVDIAKSDEYSNISPVQECINGHWCHVLSSPNSDVLWLDMQLGGTLVRRDIFDLDKHVLQERYQLDDIREVADGIWMPYQITDTEFDTSSARTTKIREVQLKISNICVNVVEEKQFEYEPLPGSLRYSDDKSEVQVVNGGIDHLDRIARWLKVNIHTTDGNNRTSVSVWSIAIAIFVATILVFWIRSKTASPMHSKQSEG
jgi:hypothetical protein